MAFADEAEAKKGALKWAAAVGEAIKVRMATPADKAQAEAEGVDPAEVEFIAERWSPSHHDTPGWLAYPPNPARPQGSWEEYDPAEEAAWDAWAADLDAQGL